MLIKDRFFPFIAQSFQVSAIGRHSRFLGDVSEEEKGRIWVNYQWVAQVTNWWNGHLTIAYSQFHLLTGTLLKGVLLAPKNIVPMEFLGSNPLRAVAIDDQVDLVAQALQHINLFEEAVGIVPGNERIPWIDLYLYMGNGHREIHYSGSTMRDPSWLRLWDALFQTVELLQAKYADPEIDAYLNRGPAGPAAPGFEKYVRRLR